MVSELNIDKSKWVKVKLNDVVTKKEDNDRENAKNRFNRFLKVEHLDPESLHVKRWSDQENDELPPTFYKIFRKGQILFPTRNPHLRRTALASFDGICGEKTLTLEPNLDRVIPEFLPLLFHSESFYAHTTGSIIGSTNPHVRWRDVANYEFLLPPKEQQAQLAELLWAMDDVIEKTLALLKEIRVTIQNIFENRVNEADGQYVPLSEVLVLKKDKSSVPHSHERYIGLEDIESGAFSCSSYTDSKAAKSSCYVIEEGDLCYSKLRPYLDKAFIANFSAVSTTELLVYKTKQVSEKYVLHYFHSNAFISYASGLGFGTKMPRVNHKIIGEFPIKIIQGESDLIDEVSEIQNTELQVKIKLEHSQLLQRSLINQVF